MIDIPSSITDLSEDDLAWHNRPWGRFAVLFSTSAYQVKKLEILPEKRLSLQKHQHRSEHWIIVAGTAEVSLDGESMMMGSDESVFIPRGSVHRLHNPGQSLLSVIEVQTGDYFGEDDIMRFEDDFGRTVT